MHLNDRINTFQQSRLVALYRELQHTVVYVNPYYRFRDPIQFLIGNRARLNKGGLTLFFGSAAGYRAEIQIPIPIQEPPPLPYLPPRPPSREWPPLREPDQDDPDDDEPGEERQNRASFLTSAKVFSKLF